jgi:hypothetical protein
MYYDTQINAEDLYYIHIFSIYLDETSSIEKIKREKYFMKEVNKVSVEDLKEMLKRETTVYNKKRYYPFSILKYNIPEDAKSESGNLVSLKRIDTITFQKSPQLFHDLNELIIIYHQYPNVKEIILKKNATRKNITSYALLECNNHKKTKRRQIKTIKI